LHRGVPVFQGDVHNAIKTYYSLYAEDTKSSNLEITKVSVTDDAGRERDVFEPGAAAVFTVQMKALADISNAHACMYVRTRDGQPLFDTATSRYADTRLTLTKGNSATAVFRVTLNLQNGVFPLGFSVSSEFDEYFVYCNMGLKQLVITGDRKANGVVHLNPQAELRIGQDESETVLQPNVARA
jgi:hypothetical protein